MGANLKALKIFVGIQTSFALPKKIFIPQVAAKQKRVFEIENDVRQK